MRDKLDKTDRRIIYELDRNCRIPETRLAQLVGKSKEAVRYRIRKLREESIIKGFTIFVDGTMAGLETYKFYLHTREKPALIRSFLKHVRTQPNAVWLGTGDGAWNVGVTFFAKSKAVFFREKNELFSHFRKLVVGQLVGAVVETHVFGKKFLAQTDEHVEEIRVLGSREKNKVDAKDVSILRCLIENGRMPYVEIASRTKLKPEAVRSSVKAMERSGIIAIYTAMLDYRKLGFEFYKTFLYFEGLVGKEERRLFEIARRHPNVVSYLKVLAPWDIELEIMAENYHDYNEIINYFREKFSDTLVKVDTTVLNVDEILPSKDVPEFIEA